jgi:hypothetical protein
MKGDSHPEDNMLDGQVFPEGFQACLFWVGKALLLHYLWWNTKGVLPVGHHLFVRFDAKILPDSHERPLIHHLNS